jgi:diguanylate cyclase (GGDEF)-like protein
MARRACRTDDGVVLRPSWPVSERFPRRLTSPAVTRRVDAAQRRGLRTAVTVAAVATAAFVAGDALRSLQFLGDAGRDVALVQAGEIVALAFLIWLASRRVRRIELLTLALAALVYGVLLVRLWLLPDSGTLSVAYMVTVLVGTGLFLPWSARWHGAWLAIAVGMTAGAMAVLPGLAGTVDEPWNLVIATGSAALISLLGQHLWQKRLRRMLEQQFELREVNRYAQRQEVHASVLNRELSRAVRRDTLTGVGNRLALDETLAGLLDPADRLRPGRFALILLDIDHFKAYNDEHGHLAGDAALERLGELLRQATRGDDLAFRYGGEEFLLLLPGLDLDAAVRVAERIRQGVADGSGELPPFTLSAGVALWEPADGRDPEPILRRADAALYRAKRAGRNRVAADTPSVAMRRETLARVG